MARIHILSAQEAQKIAAGEVVERPASVIKELIENALDAKATHITVTIEDGGKKLIRVSDNGCGMSAEDAERSIELHATSKITSVDELATLHTFGFRGEALSALAAASRMIIITKESGTHEGIKLTIEHGVVRHKEPIAAQTGTTIEAHNLFYTIPARQKFLKKRETETRQIQQLFNALCIAHPTLHGKLYADGTLLAHYLPTNDIHERCATILKLPTHETLLPLHDTMHGIELTGVAADHQTGRYDRTGIMIFVNKRWIKNTELSRAIIRAYTNALPPGRFPVAVVIITIPGSEVDINVHPRKEEVQCMHPSRVEGLVQRAIKKALEERVASLVETTKKPAFFPSSPAAHTYPPLSYQYPINHSSASLQYNNQVPLPSYTHTSLGMLQPPQQNEDISPTALRTPDAFLMEHTSISSESVEQHDSGIIGQLFETYILVQTEEGLLIVDQHAAHESILYEQFEQRFSEIATVQLLFPEIIDVAAHEWDMLEPYLGVLSHHGISLEQFGPTQIRVTGTPVHCKNTAIEELIRSMIALIYEQSSLDNASLVDLLHKKMRAQMACKAAVKAGDILDQKQMHDLLKSLKQISNRLTCPHGRPTCWLISHYEIEKKFKRIG
jgi:DNA mismatch repair protein MutL